MSELDFDTLDALISLSVKQCVLRDVEEFMNTEITVSPDPKFTKKIERLVRREARKSERRPVPKTLKVIAVACLIALSILFTACVSITTIREAIWNAIVEWYDDYIQIEFTPTDKPSTDDSGAAETEPETEAETLLDAATPAPTPEPPKKIEQINAPTKVPYGYTVTAYTDSAMYYQEYYDENSEFVFMFTQSVKGTSDKVDNLEAEVIYTKINGCDAVLITGADGLISLAWEDGCYSYMLNGIFASQDEIIEIANSVSVLEP